MKAFVVAIAACLFPLWAFAQANETERLLRRAIENAHRYTDAMRSLTAEETRVTEVFDGNGKIDRRRTTVSDLVIHQAGTESSGSLAEFRNVREVDGKPIRDRQERLNRLSKSLASAESVSAELELVNRESSRYDLDAMRVRGYTLNQAWPLEVESLWPAFEFRREGQEIVSGRDTTVISFRQVRDDKALRPAGNIFDVMKIARTFYRGKVWIEERTAQIWRYEVEIMAEDRSLTSPAVLDRMEFYYVPSSFGIPIPRKITWTAFTEWSRVKNQLKLQLSGRVTADYGPFKRFATDVQIVPIPQSR